MHFGIKHEAPALLPADIKLLQVILGLGVNVIVFFKKLKLIFSPEMFTWRSAAGVTSRLQMLKYLQLHICTPETVKIKTVTALWQTGAGDGTS